MTEIEHLKKRIKKLDKMLKFQKEIIKQNYIFSRDMIGIISDERIKELSRKYEFYNFNS